MCFFCLHCINMVYYINFHILSHTWILRKKSHLVMLYNPFNIGFIQFCWGFLHLQWSEILACNFLMFLSGFGIKVIFAFKMTLEVFPPLLFFGNIWEGLILIFLWMFSRIHQESHPVLDFVCREVSYYKLGIFTHNCHVQIFYNFVIHYWFNVYL